MPANLPQQWAVNLKKGLQTSNFASNVNEEELFKKQQKENKNFLEYYKKQLVFACQKKDSEQINNYLKKLIKLRAEQITLFYRQQKATHGEITDSMINEQENKYLKDCAKLIATAEKYLN